MRRRERVFLDFELMIIRRREDGHHCGFSIFYIIKHSDGRQDAFSFCTSTLTADRMLPHYAQVL